MCIRDRTELICEEFIIVENTFVITKDNFKKVINIKEEKQIKFNKTNLINSAIPIVRHTHTSRSHKIKTRVKYNNYHCNEKRRTIRNTTQTCAKYDVRYTHDNYKANDNYNHNCSNYDEYYHCLLYTSR